MAPKYILNYFPTPGRAEVARLMFKCAGVEFTDNMIPPTEWPNLKTDTKRFPLNQMPTLEVDGKIICQTGAISGYVANELGYYGENNLERVDIDQIRDTLHEEIVPKFIGIMFNKELNDEEKAKKAAEILEQDDMKKSLNFIVSFLKSNNDGKGFIVGNKISIADFLLYVVDSMLSKIIPTYKDSYPELTGLVDRIKAIEAIKKHNAERKY